MNKPERFSDPGQEKLQRWEEVKRKVESIKDKLGLEIDGNIREAIIWLTLFDIHTTASCEGHTDWWTFVLYIDVKAKEAREREAEIDRIKNLKRCRILHGYHVHKDEIHALDGNTSNHDWPTGHRPSFVLENGNSS